MKVISISGGRSSAMMLKIMLDNGQVDSDTIVVFANTGREHDATLDFVRECEIRWGVPIVWLEFRAAKPKFEVVTYETASRRFGDNNSRPFRELIQQRNYLPNPTQRMCTGDMKIKTIRRYIRSLKHRGDIPTYIGLRYDEPDRVAKKKESNATGDVSEFYYMPLYDMRITVAERNEFWKNQGFDLGISSTQDNCDLCFLKGMWEKIWTIREDPESVKFWIEMEEYVKPTTKKKRQSQFRKEYSYSTLQHIAETQLVLPFIEPRTTSISCSCGD